MPQENSKFIPLNGDAVSPVSPLKIDTTGSKTGKFIPLDLTPSIRKTNLSPENEQKFRDQYGDMDSTLKSGAPALPYILGIGGTLLGGPAAGAAGAAIGSGVNTGVQGGGPLDIAKDAAISGGSTYLGGKVLGSIESRLGAALAATFFNKGVRKLSGEPNAPDLPTELTDLGKDLGLNFGLNIAGGMLGNKLLSRKASPGEPLSTVAGKIRDDLVHADPEVPTFDISKDYNKLTSIPAKPTTEYGASAQKAIRGNLARATDIENKAFDNFRTSHVEPNTQTLTKLVGYEQGTIIDPKTGKAPLIPKTEQVQVKGPIYTLETQNLAQEVLPKLDAFMKGDTFEQLPDFAKAKYKKLYGAVKDLSTPFESVDPSGKTVQIPIHEWETLKDVRTDINRAISGKVDKTFPEAGLKKVADRLGQDMDISIGQFWKNGSDAANALEMANKATQFKKEVFNREIKSKLYGKFESGREDVRVPADPSEVFKEAYKSPEKAQRLMAAMGDSNSGYIKGDYFDNVLMKKGFGTNYSKLNPDSIVNELENPNSVSRVILNADERNNVLRFARAARAIGDESSENSLNFGKGKFTLNLGLGASRLLTGSTTPGRIVIGAKQLAEAIRDNKQVADLASRLIKIRPDSAEAQQSVKMLIRGLRGAEVIFSSGANEGERKGTIGENGKISFN